MANWFGSRRNRQYQDENDPMDEDYGRRYDWSQRNEFERGQPYRGVYDYNRQRNYSSQDPVRGRGYDPNYNRPDYGYGRMRGSNRDIDRNHDTERDMDFRKRSGYSGDYGNMGRMDYDRPYDYNRQSSYGQDFERGMDFFDEDFDQPVQWTYTEYWLIPGPFTGMGPMGYQRSDERIREDIFDRLTQHGRVDASNIQAEVENGEVTLRGMVRDRAEKRMAEDAVESISGVKDVHNEIRVQKLGRENREKMNQQEQQAQNVREGQSAFQNTMGQNRGENR